MIKKKKEKGKKNIKPSCYDPDLDDDIIKTIENNKEGKCSFNELKNILKISSRTLTKHLTILEDETRNIIERDKNKTKIPWSTGTKRYIRLTQNTKTKRKYYGPFRLDYRNVKGLCKDKKMELEKDTQKYRRTKLVLYLLFSLASGYLGYKSSSKKGVVINGGNDREGNSTTKTVAATKPEIGFSPNDLERRDYQLSIIQTSMRLNRFEKEEAEDLLNEIVEYKEIDIKPFHYNGQIRYKIEDETLQDFFIYCRNIITTLIHVMRAYFFFHFNKQEEPEERQWFYNIVGDETANTFFQKIEENQAENKTIQNLYIEFYQHDKKSLDSIIQNCKKLDKDFFTKKKLENRLLGKSNPNSLVYQLIMDSEDINQRQEKYEHPTEGNRYPFIQLKDKYPFLFDGDELKNLVNPPFSRKWFKIDLFM